MAERRPGTRRPPVALALLLVAVLALLTGCVDLPRRGPVEGGPAPAAPDPALGFLAEGPPTGASPETVVEGFLRASAAFDDDSATARLFLTPRAARSWRPSERVVVIAASGLVVGGTGASQPAADPGRPTSTVTQGTVQTVRVTAPLVGEVDRRGRWTTAPPRASYSVDLDVVRADGVWRLSDPPDEVVVSHDVFRQVYRAYPLTFLDPTRTALVPELRWFPGRSPSATLLVSELLAGPSEWLAGAVTTAFPEGTRLLSSPPAVPLDPGGTAVVDLSDEARAADPGTRLLMEAQLRATLSPVPGVREVQLSSAGSALGLPDAQLGLLDPLAPAGPPVVLSGGRIARLDGDGAELVPGLLDVSSLLPSDPAVGVDGLFAVLVQQRGRLLVGVPDESEDGPGLRGVLAGEDLVAPSVDVRGWVWTTPAEAGGEVLAVDAAGEVRTVESPWLDGRRVRALQVSRDGARVVVASTDADGRAHLDVAGVVRDGEGAPVRLDVPDAPPVPGLVSVTDAGWQDATTVVAVGSLADGPPQLLRVAVDGSDVRSVEVPEGVERLTSAEAAGRVLLDAPGGGVLQPAGLAWVVRPGSETSTDPSYPG
ncbi:LpqB family beta-propeller domain-containing protein [uncultured Pseudokineococcus sp.]|uniref:LpqB family beta-propeller domain-containing protein n=1 Tax=uncultured Pseudokineococcus sp. TaxID=1642928 RepID=UPI002638454B|nr:LpqB family beta-propeller domain-containing protein [uncultured Pseudokineococcus sp.]